MNYQVNKIHLSVEKQDFTDRDYSEEYTDVIVELVNGDVYVASFFTHKNIEEIMLKNKESGDYLSGKYFWVEVMVIVDECSLETVRKIVDQLIDEGDFDLAFRKI